MATSQGKGIDEDSARTSALMEAIELWHAEHIDDARLRWDSYGRLRRSAATVDVIVTRGPVAPNVPMLGIEGYCLITRRPTWVPFELVSHGEMPIAGVPTSPFWNTTTGLASGNHILEAITHGLCEVIERHCEVSWAEERSGRVDPETIMGGIAGTVLAMLKEAGVYTCIWDCTRAEIDIPVYACEVLDPLDTGRPRLLGSYNGSGCHLSAEVALARAITEAVQSRLTYIAGSRDDTFRSHYASTQNATVHELQWQELHAVTEMRSFARTSLSTGTFGEDVALLVRAIERSGARQVVVVDLTRKEMGIPVVEVIVDLRSSPTAGLAAKEAGGT